MKTFFLTIGILILLQGSILDIFGQNAPEIKWSDQTKSGAFFDGNTFFYLGCTNINQYLFLIKDAYLNRYDDSLNLVYSYKIDTGKDRILRSFYKNDSIYFGVLNFVKSDIKLSLKAVEINHPELYPSTGKELGYIENYDFRPKVLFSDDSSKLLIYGVQKIEGQKYVYYKVFDKNFNKLWENKTIKYNYFKYGKVLLSNDGSVYRCDFRGKQYTDPVMISVTSDGKQINEETVNVDDDIISAPYYSEVNNQVMLVFMYFKKGNLITADDKIGGMRVFSYKPEEGKQLDSYKLDFTEEERNLAVNTVKFINGKYNYFCEHTSNFELFNNTGTTTSGGTSSHPTAEYTSHGKISILIVDNKKIEKIVQISKSQKNNTGAAEYFNSYNIIQANGYIYLLYNVRPKCIESGCNEYFPVGMNIQAKPKIYRIDKNYNVDEVKLKYLNHPDTELSVTISHNVVIGNKLILFGESGFKTAIGIVEF